MPIVAAFIRRISLQGSDKSPNWRTLFMLLNGLLGRSFDAIHNISGRERAIRVVHRPPVSAGAPPALLDLPRLFVLDHRRGGWCDGARRGAGAHDRSAGRAEKQDPWLAGPRLCLEDRRNYGLRIGSDAPARNIWGGRCGPGHRRQGHHLVGPCRRVHHVEGRRSGSRGPGHRP